jgi:hypothetical protein
VRTTTYTSWHIICTPRFRLGPDALETSVRTDHVVLFSDLYMVIILCAGDQGLAIGLAMVALGHDPRVRQRVIDYRHFVVENVGIGFVEENPLPDDSRIVLVQGNAAVIVSAGSGQIRRGRCRRSLHLLHCNGVDQHD